MLYSSVLEGYVKYVDGKWVPITTTSTDGVKTIEIGGSSPMPVYLYAALVIPMDMSMNAQMKAVLWQNWPYSMYCRESEILGRDSS